MFSIRAPARSLPIVYAFRTFSKPPFGHDLSKRYANVSRLFSCFLNRPEIGNGIGGLMYNGAHAYIEMAAGNTMVGFLKIIKTANVLIR